MGKKIRVGMIGVGNWARYGHSLRFGFCPNMRFSLFQAETGTPPIPLPLFTEFPTCSKAANTWFSTPI